MAKKNGNGGGTAMATMDCSDYLSLQPGSEVAEALAANLMSGETIDPQDLVRISTPTGGGTTWIWDGLSGEESAKEITGILVCVQPRGVLWPSEEPTESMPLLVSYDLVVARKVGEDFGDIDPLVLEQYRLSDTEYDWVKLPWNQWGSGKNGIGKRCKESRVLFILRPGDTWPVVVTAQPGSLKTIRPFIKQLTVPHWRAVVALSLQKVKSRGGQEYAQIKPRLISPPLSKEDGQRVFTTYTEPIRQITKRVPIEREQTAEVED